MSVATRSDDGADTDAVRHVIDGADHGDQRQHAENDGDQHGDVRHDRRAVIAEVASRSECEQAEHRRAEHDAERMLQVPVPQPVAERAWGELRAGELDRHQHHRQQAA